MYPAAAALMIASQVTAQSQTPPGPKIMLVMHGVPGHHPGQLESGDGGAAPPHAREALKTAFNTAGMYRGWIGSDGVPHVAIYKE